MEFVAQIQGLTLSVAVEARHRTPRPLVQIGSHLRRPAAGSIGWQLPAQHRGALDGSGLSGLG